MRVNEGEFGLVNAAQIPGIQAANRIRAGLDPVTGKSDKKFGATSGRGLVQVSSDIGFTSTILETIPLQMRARAVYEANIAAANVVAKQARNFLKQEGPRGPGQGAFPANSKKTRTYDKKSAKQRAERDARQSMVARIRVKTLPKRRGSSPHVLSMVGPRRDDGRMDQGWILEYGGVIKLWGLDEYYRLKPRPFMGPAGKITTPEQRIVYIASMKKWWSEVGRIAHRDGGIFK